MQQVAFRDLNLQRRKHQTEWSMATAKCCCKNLMCQVGMSGAPAPKEGEKVTYGVMPGPSISRGISIVLEETVDVDGVTISFDTILKAMGAFFQKWKTEDEET